MLLPPFDLTLFTIPEPRPPPAVNQPHQQKQQTTRRRRRRRRIMIQARKVNRWCDESQINCKARPLRMPKLHPGQILYSVVVVVVGGRTILPHHRNSKTLARFGVERLIIAYSRPRNLGNYLSPRKLSGPVAVSAIIDDMRRVDTAAPLNLTPILASSPTLQVEVTKTVHDVTKRQNQIQNSAKTLARFGVERLIIAYSRPRNLGNNFSPRKLSGPGVAVSAIIDDMRRYSSASNPNPSFP
jgi:hypothetical protein